MNVSRHNPELGNPQPAIDPPAPGFRFGLASLLLMITLISVCLAVYAVVPGLGVCLAVVSLPALARTGVIAHRRRRDQRPLGMLDCVGEFAIALLMTLSTILFVVVAFMVAFVPATLFAWTLDIDALYVVGWLTGFALALLVTLFAVKYAWPLPESPRHSASSAPVDFDHPDSPAPHPQP